MNNIDKLKSTCCKAETKVIGGDEGTMFWQCLNCGKACDIWFPKKNHIREVPKMVWEEEFDKTLGNKLAYIGHAGEEHLNKIKQFIQDLLNKQQADFIERLEEVNRPGSSWTIADAIRIVKEK